MKGLALEIVGTGLVTSVGLSAPASCAAFRSKSSNPSQTKFLDAEGGWMMAHQIELEQPWRGLAKLAKMAAMAIKEVLAAEPNRDWSRVPLLLCIAEPERPGRLSVLDRSIQASIELELRVRFAAESSLIPHGRVGIASSFKRAQMMFASGSVERVLVACTDSLLQWPTLSHYQKVDRLLSSQNSDGFMPGEGAGAVLLARAQQASKGLVCTGIGFGNEIAHVDSESALRGDGLSSAILQALEAAETAMHEMDFRIADSNGEQYYFKEASLALLRTLKKRKEEFDLWHPAECAGELGATAGAALIAFANAACMDNYAHGPNILIHMANDSGRRAAMSMRYQGGR